MDYRTAEKKFVTMGLQLVQKWLITVGNYEPHAMTLSTIEETGAPEARILGVQRNENYNSKPN